MDSASRPTESAAVGRYYCHSCDGEIGSVTNVYFSLLTLLVNKQFKEKINLFLGLYVPNMSLRIY